MQTALMLIALITCAGFAYGGDRDTTVMGHHIRLEGSGMDEAFQKMHEFRLKQCAEQNLTVAPIPAGEKLSFYAKDYYFVPGGVINYDLIKSFLVKANPPCQLAPNKNEKAVIDSPGGICSVDLVLRAASGNCRISIAQLSKKRIRHSYIGADIPTGEVRTIAGHKCEVYEGEIGEFFGRVCYASKDTFDGLAYGLRGARGPKLSEEAFLKSDLKTPIISLTAVKVESNIPIPVSVLLPQLGDNFIIKNNR